MNHITKILERRSERKYMSKDIEKEKLDKIFNVINSSPTSNNSHNYSVIVVRDKNLRKEISLNMPSQQHIVDAPLLLLFCADLNRVDYLANKNNININSSALNNLITAAGDCYIAATWAHSAALELGLGACYLGVVRKSFAIIQKTLNLQNRMIPTIGLTIGYIESQNEIKPKINHVYFDKYDLDLVKKEVDDYDKKMLSYYSERSSNNNHAAWSQTILKAFQYDFNEVDEFIKKQWDLSK